MTGPLFSIVTVVRDDAAGLARTHASLRRQTWRDFEWIVVDGGSTDGSREYLLANQTEISWWRSAPDGGVYDAMNRGLAASCGGYLLFLNAGDDIPERNTLESFAMALKSADWPEFCYGDAWERSTSGQLLYKPARSHHRSWYGMFTHHQSMLYRSTILHDLCFDPGYPIGADYAFTLQVLARADSILHMPQPLCVFSAGGRSEQRAAAGRRDQALIRKRLLNHGFIRRSFVTLMQFSTFTARKAAPVIFSTLRCRRMARPGIPAFEPILEK